MLTREETFAGLDRPGDKEIVVSVVLGHSQSGKASQFLRIIGGEISAIDCTLPWALPFVRLWHFVGEST